MDHDDKNSLRPFQPHLHVRLKQLIKLKQANQTT